MELKKLSDRQLKKVLSAALFDLAKDIAKGYLMAMMKGLSK